MTTLTKASKKKLTENKIIDIAYRIDNLPFPPSNEDMKMWEKELLDLNLLLMELDIIFDDQ